MLSDADHNKLIKLEANSVLKPNGLFQKGSSRTWIDDNGWFLIIVEFQPSNWGKGSYLNVSVHYLWDDRDYLSFDYGHRLCSFVPFDGNEEKFRADIRLLAQTALEKVKEYRHFNDLQYAKIRILQSKAIHIIHTLYPRMMICGLCRDACAVSYYKELMLVLESTDIAWTRKYYTELSGNIAPIIHDPQMLHSYICEKIRRQREFWRSKSGMKKLRGDFLL